MENFGMKSILYMREEECASNWRWFFFLHSFTFFWHCWRRWFIYEDVFNTHGNPSSMDAWMLQYYIAIEIEHFCKWIKRCTAFQQSDETLAIWAQSLEFTAPHCMEFDLTLWKWRGNFSVVSVEAVVFISW